MITPKIRIKNPINNARLDNNAPSLIADFINMYIENNQTDFSAGTLSNVTATAGGLQLCNNSLTITEDFEDTNYNVTISGNWALGTPSHTGTQGYISTNHANSSSSTGYIDFTIGTNGNVSLWYYVSSEANYDKFYLYLDGVVKINGVSGNIGWTQVSYPVLAGSHQIKLVYTKDGTNSLGSDLAAIDDLIIVRDNYLLSGNKISQPITMFGIADNLATISWSALTPTGTNLNIKCAITNDMTIPNDEVFTDATNGSLVPGINIGDTLDGKYLWIKEILSSTDVNITPTLTSLEVDVNVSNVPISLVIESDITSLFNSPRYLSSTFANTLPLVEKTYVPTMVNGFYYCRAKATVNSVNYYSVINAITISSGMKQKALYQHENIGKLFMFQTKRILYQYENVGKGTVFNNKRALYHYDNTIKYQGTNRRFINYI